MNAQKQFYDEERANKGVKRDVKDVIGELNRIASKKQIKEQTELAIRPTRSKKKTFSEKDYEAVKPSNRSISNKRVTRKISYAESSSEDDIYNDLDFSIVQTK